MLLYDNCFQYFMFGKHNGFISKARISARMHVFSSLENVWGFGDAVVRASAFHLWDRQGPFTSEIVRSILATDLCEKSQSTRSAESRGFSPGAPVSSHAQGMLTGWVRINTVTVHVGK